MTLPLTKGGNRNLPPVSSHEGRGQSEERAFTPMNLSSYDMEI
jgi:hypothetical protein